MRRLTVVAACVSIGVLCVGAGTMRVNAAPQRAARPLAIEDFYRVQTVGGVAISPDGRWVAFTVSNRIEATNGSTTESYLVAAEGSGRPRRIQHEGKDVSAPSFTAAGRLRYTSERQSWTVDPAVPASVPTKAEAPAAGTVSPDGKWTVVLRDKPRPARTPAPMTDFERRHADRFKGAIFDWMEFQRDGQPFPAPDPTARPAQQIVLQPIGGAAPEKVLFDEDLRPTGLTWHPGGRRLAFVADPSWREEVKYEHPNIWTVGTDGPVTRLTNDG
jgi:dipeptidyl aminopeptidase/acylaminoacyl peptidase